MKNKIKLLTIGTMATLLFPTITNAASITINGKPNGNTASYTINYTKADEDTDQTITISISNSNQSVTPNNTSKISGGTCNDSTCTIPVGEIASGVPVAIATVVLSNNTEQDIINNTLTVSLNGYDRNLEGITLTAGKTTPTTQARTLSSDATLSGISVSIGMMDQAFSKELTTYNITGIKDTINSVTVTPTCDNNCTWSLTCPTGECSISSLKKVTLNEGSNQVAINVESEDGKSKKTYTLNIYRGEVKTNSAYLSNIKIKGTALSPAFDSLTNDYTAKVGLSVDKLDITTISEDPNATVVIKGADKLKKGENTVTITVTSSDGETKQVYTIIVTKEKMASDEDDKKELSTTKVSKKKNNTWLIILLSILGLGIIIGAYFLIFKKKKNKKNKNDKNDSNNNSNNDKDLSKQDVKEDKLIESTKDINLIDEELESETSSYAKTQSLDDLQREMQELMKDDEPKQDVDEALDDLMKTKKLELGDLDF